jgi:hypothetical protein
MKKMHLLALLSATGMAAPATQASESIDIAQLLIGRGNQAVVFQCRDHTVLKATYEIRPDLGPTLLFTQDSQEVFKIGRYLQPQNVPYEINQATLAQSKDGSAAVSIYWSSKSQVDSLELGRMQANSFISILRCVVQSTTVLK